MDNTFPSSNPVLSRLYLSARHSRFGYQLYIMNDNNWLSQVRQTLLCLPPLQPKPHYHLHWYNRWMLAIVFYDGANDRRQQYQHQNCPLRQQRRMDWDLSEGNGDETAPIPFMKQHQYHDHSEKWPILSPIQPLPGQKKWDRRS